MPAVLDTWNYSPQRAGRSLVFPDGCRDVIVVRSARGQRWFVSELDARARSVTLLPGAEYRGWRLQPGAQIEEGELARVAQRAELSDAALAACSWVSPEVDELLEVLRASTSVREAAQRAGVSPRTLQRHVPWATGKPALFWMRLARCRRAALAVRRSTPLVEAALTHGFSDQAHMSREFRAWLSLSPREIQRALPKTAALEASGYG